MTSIDLLIALAGLWCWFWGMLTTAHADHEQQRHDLAIDEVVAWSGRDLLFFMFWPVTVPAAWGAAIWLQFRDDLRAGALDPEKRKLEKEPITHDIAGDVLAPGHQPTEPDGAGERPVPPNPTQQTKE